MHERGGEDSDHHLHRAPVDQSLCCGCFQFGVEMELFLIQGTGMGSTPMGDWTAGWMREIIDNPRKHLEDYNPSYVATSPHDSA